MVDEIFDCDKSNCVDCLTAATVTVCLYAAAAEGTWAYLTPNLDL